METYNVIASGTVLWLLASAGSTNTHLPFVLAASLTVGVRLVSRAMRSRREKH